MFIGAAAAMLFAPQSGKATRDIIAARSREAKGRASQVASSASQKAQYMSSKIKQAI
jgi:gas vesicle protein